jgi:hypothetical protein
MQDGHKKLTISNKKIRALAWNRVPAGIETDTRVRVLKRVPGYPLLSLIFNEHAEMAIQPGAVLAQKFWGAWSPLPTQRTIQFHRERALKETWGPKQQLGGLGLLAPA